MRVEMQMETTVVTTQRATRAEYAFGHRRASWELFSGRTIALLRARTGKPLWAAWWTCSEEKFRIPDRAYDPNLILVAQCFTNDKKKCQR